MTNEEAIEILDERRMLISKEYLKVNEEYAEALNLAIKALERADTNVGNMAGWIPVSEGLPARDVNVLAYHRNESFEYQYVSWIDEYSGKWAGFIGNLSDKVLAWMPLPEPYKENAYE